MAGALFVTPFRPGSFRSAILNFPSNMPAPPSTALLARLHGMTTVEKLDIIRKPRRSSPSTNPTLSDPVSGRSNTSDSSGNSDGDLAITAVQPAWPDISVATVSKPKRDMHGASKKTTTFKGICWHVWTKKWEARTRHKGKQIALGCFDDQDEAARIYDQAVYWLHAGCVQAAG